MSIKYADVIVDLQAGDTGKGKVAHALAGSGEYDVVLRYNGGANAGHTVYHNGVKVVTHQVPIGVLFGIPSIIGLGCVVNIPALYDELEELKKLGFYTDGLLMIDKRTHVVTEEHLEQDGTESVIGTTRKGIGPAYRDKYARKGIRIGDIPLSFQYPSFTVIDVYEYLHESSKELRILCEGAQGFQIDIDWGDYPYVTSSHCTVGSVCLNGIPPKKIRKIYGIMKAYETYSGFKTHFTDENNEAFKAIQKEGNEFGATTGRPRKVRWLDINGVLQAIAINGVTDLIINKSDILSKVNAASFMMDGIEYKFETIESFRTAVNKYMNMVNTITWSTTPNGI